MVLQLLLLSSSPNVSLLTPLFMDYHRLYLAFYGSVKVVVSTPPALDGRPPEGNVRHCALIDSWMLLQDMKITICSN